MTDTDKLKEEKVKNKSEKERDEGGVKGETLQVEPEKSRVCECKHGRECVRWEETAGEWLMEGEKKRGGGESTSDRQRKHNRDPNPAVGLSG